MRESLLRRSWRGWVRRLLGEQSVGLQFPVNREYLHMNSITASSFTVVGLPIE